MIFFVPFAVGSVVVAIAAVGRRKRSRPADVPAPASPAERTFMMRMGLLPLVDEPRALRIAHTVRPAATRSEAEVETFGALKEASAGVGLGVAGLFFFPLQLAGVAFQTRTIAGEFKGAYRSLVHERRLKGEVLSAVFISAAAAGGLFVPLTVGGWFVAVARWLAIKAEDNSKRGIADLFRHQFGSVSMVIGGVEVEVPAEQVQAGDVIAIRAGQTIPMDGVIAGGHASIDQRVLTGESQPAEKGPGDSVLAATVVLAGRIRVRVERAGESTAVAQISRVLTNPSDLKQSLAPRAEAFNERMAGPFLLLGAVSFPLVGLSRALSLMIAAPGSRMSLYGPLSMHSYPQAAAQEGILVKDGRSLELVRDIDTVVFDTTGVLTGQPHVRSIHACPGFSERQVLTLAAAAEAKQSHPIARAILAEAAARGIEVPAIGDANDSIGYGITVWLGGVTVLVGGRRFMETHQVAVPEALDTVHASAHSAGDFMVWVALNHTLAGAIVLHPTLRPEARAMLDQLRKRGAQLYILSGGHDAPPRQFAATPGTDGYFAGVLPEDKAVLIRELQAQGRKVCFVGGGIDDSIAIQSADVSVSLHGAATIATDRAQIVLMSGDPAQLDRIFALGDEFAANRRVHYYAATLPCVLIVGGTLILGWGLLPSLILCQISVPFALYKWPWMARTRGDEASRSTALTVQTSSAMRGTIR